ncbi:hypothetical protein KSP39_PZI006303 [Platanthera zijinensis]|uniref:Uncharacterized protein n=1 Tax=Platanthera zijinensis TaxID=2320716 RepID=A0AAP0BS67_9ASPA
MTEVKMASFGTSSATIKERPAAVTVKRKASHARLDDFCPEINGRPLKRPFLDSEKISLSNHASTETLKSKRLLEQHVTVSIFEAIEAILQSLARLVRNVHFEQIWNNEKEVIDSLLKICHLYNVVRVDGEDEKPIKKKGVQVGCRGISPEDNSILFNYLPLLREYVPSAVEEIESEIKAHVSSEASGSVSEANDTKEISIDYPSVQVKDEDAFNDLPDSYYYSEDSNAEDHPRNDYPNESMEDNKADPFGDSECTNSDYEEETDSKSKKDEETSSNGDEDMEAFSNSEYSDSEHDDEDNLSFSNSEYSDSEHDDENNLRLIDSDYDSEHSNAENHPRKDYHEKKCSNSDYEEEMASKSKKDEETSNNGDEDKQDHSEHSNVEVHPKNDYPDKESLDDNKADPFSDSECPNSDYDEEMASKSKKDEETSNNGDEDMEALSNSEYSDSEHDDENNLRLPDSDYDSEHSNAEDHPRNDYPDKKSSEDYKANTFGDSECSKSDYEEEMASKSKKDEEKSNNGAEDICIAAEDHPINDYPNRESLEDDEAGPFGVSECSNSDHKKEMASKSKKDEETSNNGATDMEAFSDSDYDSEDSNAEDHPRITLTRSSWKTMMLDSFSDSECSSSDYEEEMACKSKKDEETSNNGDECMEVFSNSENSNSEYDDEDNFRLQDSDYDSEDSNADDHPRITLTSSWNALMLESLGDSECSNSDYEEKMANKSKKAEETSSNGDDETSSNEDEDMDAFSDSEYSDS